MSEEKIQKAFSRIKEDVAFLQHEIIILKQEMHEINSSLSKILSQFKQFLPSNTSSTHVQHIKNIPTHDLPIKALNPSYFHSSIGNRGVPTNSQQIVNRQSNTLNRTSQAPKNFSYEHLDFPDLRRISGSKPIIKSNQINMSKLPELSSIVTSMRQDLQDKFKKLTRQEFLVFSILYTLEEEQGSVTYRDIASRANLAESSVRDYISRLEHKGIPVVKERVNNKIVLLKIPQELRNIATLDSLSKLVRF